MVHQGMRILGTSVIRVQIIYLMELSVKELCVTHIRLFFQPKNKLSLVK